MDIEDILRETDDGDMVLASMANAVIHLDRDQMNRELIAAGSDPEFFPDEEEF